MDTNVKAESKSGGVIARANLYAHASKYALEAIDFLATTMRDERTQKSVRVSAANKLIDKCLPDLKATELTGEDSGPIQFVIVKDAQAEAATNE